MYKKLLILILFVTIAFISQAQERVLVGMPDPAIVQGSREGVFYIFATGKGLPVYRSKDLVEWEQIGRVFSKAVPEWAQKAIPKNHGIWAPDIVKLNDKFFVYYSVSYFGSQRSVIGVASNKTLDPDSPDYEWIDQGLVIESHTGKTTFNAIDPAAFQDENGNAYLIWGSYWGGIHFTRLNPKTGKLLQDPPKISIIASRPDVPSHAVEGAYLIRKDGYYYLFVSFDACCDGAESTYRIMVGRSRKIGGPYVDQDGKPMIRGGGTLVLSNNDNWRGPGHNSVLTMSKGSWIVHHTYDTFHLDRQRIIQIRPLYWTDSGWPVVGQPLSRENPMTTEKADVSQADLEGSWRFSVDYGPEMIIDLLPDGRIANRKRARWGVSENRISITWPEGADGQWTGEYFIEPNGDSFIGRNREGAIIRGKMLKR